jgi:hypothetical protein
MGYISISQLGGYIIYCMAIPKEIFCFLHSQ